MKKLLIIGSLLFTQFAFGQTCDHHFFNKQQPVAKSAQVICKNKFAVGFSQRNKTVLWTSSHLTAANLSNTNVPRRDAFKPDPAVPASSQSSESAYVGTIYDKGHMVSFEDVADDELSALESFHMTNISPQVASHNRGIWKSLEIRTRKLTIFRGETYVISGPIFKAPVNTLKDGTPIPTAFFKVIIVPSTKESFTFIIPNEEKIKSADLLKYMTTLKNLNSYNADTKIKFNAQLIERLTFI